MAIDSTNSDLPDFPSPFQLGDYGDGFPCQTIKEQLIFRLLTTIRQKDDWMRKVNNQAVVAKWKEEVCRPAARAEVTGQTATAGEGEGAGGGQGREDVLARVTPMRVAEDAPLTVSAKTYTCYDTCYSTTSP